MNGKRRWPFALLTLAALFATVGLLPGKGKPPAEPPPDGTVYFSESAGGTLRSVLGMNADGSGVFNALPGTFDSWTEWVNEPSHATYGGRRLWLTAVETKHPTSQDPMWQNEIFALSTDSNGDLMALQVTSIGSTLAIDNSSLRWSNDGQDMFLSFVATEWAAPNDRCLFRLNVSGTQLALGLEFPSEWTPFPMADVQTVLCIDSNDADLMPYHDWSPDGTKVVYETDTGLFVWDTIGSSDTPIADRGHLPRWSPDGTRIAYRGRITSRSGTTTGIVSSNPDGTDARILYEDKGRLSANGPCWSPDSGHLAFTITERTNTGWDTDIARIKADGSGLTMLTSNQTSNTVLGWRQ